MVLIYFRPYWYLVCFFSLGFFLALFHAYWISDMGLPQESVNSNVWVSGRVISIPAATTTQTTFQFALNAVNHHAAHATVLMSCYQHCPPLKAGEHLEGIAKLKKVRNIGNPGAFDQEGFLDAKHIHWSGTFKTIQHHAMVHSQYSILDWRQWLSDRQHSAFHDEKILGLVQALSLAVTTHIETSEWELFRRTGTIHLMDISGDHIALLAGVIYGLFSFLWRRIPTLCLMAPAAKIGSIAALVAVTLYALLSGMAAPVARALVVCFFLLARYLGPYRYTLWQAWRYALFIVLCIEPHSVRFIGFYLSFLGVAILILVNQRFSVRGIQKKILLQLGCLLGMMPLTLYLFSYGAWSGFFVNIVAIPWVGLVVVPLVLLTTATLFFGNCHILIALCSSSIKVLLFLLYQLDALSWMNWQFGFHEVISPVLLTVLLCLLFFMPRYNFILPSVVILLSILYPAYPKPRQGEVDIHLLDVGQGLSIVVQTTSHVLIYDTGIRFPNGRDMGNIAIIPYLSTLGVNAIDAIVISHPDNDHRGGLASLEKTYMVDRLLVDDPREYTRGEACHDSLPWRWDDVDFQFFPIHFHDKKRNNHSCVLGIRTKAGQVLFTGDIEEKAEQYLVKHYGESLVSQVLLIPHHGSKTSSSLSFVKAVNPRYAMVSYGEDNIYHFPHAAALAVYQKNHIPIYNTAQNGMITVRLGERDVRIKTYRTQ